MPLRQVNLHSATTEELFERLAWFYATAQQAQIYDAEGHPYSLSTLVNLSLGKIPTAFCATERPCTEASISPKLEGTKYLLYLWRLVQIRENSRKYV